MSTYKVDDTEDIARRLKEIEADKRLALTGSTAEEPKEAKEFDDYGMYYPCGFKQQLTPEQFAAYNYVTGVDK